MELNIYTDNTELTAEVARWMVNYITTTLENQNIFTLVLSGGSTPQKLHALLASSPYKEEIDWSRLHIFWGDERAVPFEDERNNAKMAFDTLLKHVPVPTSQIHIMRTDISPEESAIEYEKVLLEYFPARFSDDKTFDLVLLGMGDDGHTLSLFPGTPVIHEEEKWVTSFLLPAQNMHRITLTAPIVNRATCVAFLVTGPGKAAALKEVIEGDYNADVYPAQVIKPISGNLKWFTDETAVALLG